MGNKGIKLILLGIVIILIGIFMGILSLGGIFTYFIQLYVVIIGVIVAVVGFLKED